MKTDTIKSSDIPMLVQIASGLLASGHYTNNDERGDPFPAEFDLGDDWKENGMASRFGFHAVEDAIRILRNIKEEVHSANEPADQNRQP